MQKFWTIAIIAASFGNAALLVAQPSSTSKKNKKSGWVNLIDKNSTKGWHRFNSPDSIGSAWQVTNGVLHLNASNKKDWQVRDGGDILSEKEYENFHLKLEWKIAPNGNSGVIFFAQENSYYKHPWLTGPEMQILDNDGHSDGKIHKHRAGDLYDLIPSSIETVKPVGEWNLAEIISNKGNLQLWLNGTKVVETTLWDDVWKRLVAGSKFKEMPDFGKFTKGHIALQDHGNDVWFKNIKIKVL